MIHNHVYLACDWTDEELNSIRNLRKVHAQLEGDNSLPKDVRKEHQKFVKSCTILIEYFYGTGRFETNSNSSTQWPAELEIYMQIALLHLWNANTENK